MTAIAAKHDVALEPMKDGRTVYATEAEYDYKSIVWSDFFTKAKYIPWWILGAVVGVLVLLLTLNHDLIVETLQPFFVKMQQTPGGFVIPIVILVVISFPPLFGHEIVALLCGAVYGLWIGFAVVAAGTFLGEAATWFAFKWVFRQKAIQLEKTNLNYGSLARLTRDGGFFIVFLIRLSAIPSHFSTAVFATCGVNFWYFLLATFLTLPKQVTVVYLGVLLVQTEAQKDSTINNIILLVTASITIIAGVYIYRKMSRTKKILIAEQETRTLDRQAKQQAMSPTDNTVADVYPPYTKLADASRVQNELVTVPTPMYGQDSYGYDPNEYNVQPTKQQEIV